MQCLIILNAIDFFFQFAHKLSYTNTYSLTYKQTNKQTPTKPHKDSPIYTDVLSPLPQVSQLDNNLEPSNAFQFLFKARPFSPFQ